MCFLGCITLGIIFFFGFNNGIAAIIVSNAWTVFVMCILWNIYLFCILDWKNCKDPDAEEGEEIEDTIKTNVELNKAKIVEGTQEPLLEK